jgi:hypothetical protein
MRVKMTDAADYLVIAKAYCSPYYESSPLTPPCCRPASGCFLGTSKSYSCVPQQVELF